MPSVGPLISAAAAAVADRTQAPVELAAHHLLTLAAMAAQRLIQVRLPTGAQRPVSTYLLTIAGAAERHATAARMIVEPIRRWEGLPSQRPLYLNLFNAPPDSGRYDRFRGFTRMNGLFATTPADLAALNRFRRAEGASLAALWDGPVIERGPSSTPPYPRLSLHLVATPREGLAFLRDPLLADAGLLGRVLALYPQSRIGARAWAAISDEPPPELETLLAALCALYRQPATVGSRCVNFTAEAARAWYGFAAEMETAMSPGGALAALSSLAGELPEHAARLAAIIALVENPAMTELDTAALENGIGLARHYAAEALRITQIPAPETDHSPEFVLQAWLEETRAGQDVSLRDVYHAGPRIVRDADTAYRTMRNLERLGVVQPKTASGEGAGAARRRAAYHWRVVRGVNELSPPGA